MNEPNHNWLNETQFDDDIWLDMLVDGELNPQQRAAFVSHVQQNNDWQRVATAFLDGQVLQQAVPFESRQNEAVTLLTSPQPSRNLMKWLALAACTIGGLMLGRWVIPPQVVTQIVQAPAPAASPDEVESPPEFIVTDTSELSLPGLFQVKDTPMEAVYYADFSMPQFMLDALVLAGHKVSFDQEFLGDTQSPDSPAAVPINVVHIEKYGRLLAVAEITHPNNP